MVDRSSVVQRVSPLQDPGWDAKIADLPGRTFFHGSAWARVLHDTYGFNPVYFTIGDKKGIQSVLPTMEVNSWLTGRRGVSLPFTDECEPLDMVRESFQGMWEEARRFATERNWKYLECRGGREKLPAAQPSTRFFGHTLDLQASEAAIFSRFDSAVRRAIRKAEQNKLSIEVSTELAAVETFHRLLCKTRKRQGVPPQPFRFFRNIQRHVLAANHGHVILARQHGKPIAGAMFFHCGKTAIFKFGASDEAYQHFRPNNLVMWHAIKLYHAEGRHLLDFGRTSLDNAGLRKFKLSWGTTEHAVEYHRYNTRTESYMTAKDRSSGWHNLVFRTLPIGMSRLFGEMFYNHAA